MFFLSLELRNEENLNVCLFLYDAVVFTSERDVKGRVLHKNQWLQCPWRASVFLQDDVHPCLRQARCLLLLCKNSKISHCLSNYVHNPLTYFFFMRFLLFIAYVNWAYRGRYRDIGCLPFTRSVRKINKLQLTLFIALLVFFSGLEKIA